jgi:hypothetical protein
LVLGSDLHTLQWIPSSGRSPMPAGAIRPGNPRNLFFEIDAPQLKLR